MNKKLFTILMGLCVVFLLTACQGSPDSKRMESTTVSDHQLTYRFAGKKEGQKLLMSYTGYHEGFTENDLQYRMQRKNATMEEYLSFAKDQVLDFSDEQKALINDIMEQIETIAADKGYHFPYLDEITFICTSQEEEGGAAGYTHQTHIYLNNALLDTCLKDDGAKSYLLYLIAHEVFHCLTRCNPDFRADMYKMIHFTVQEKEYELPPSLLNYYINNPDVVHHNAYATFKIKGKTTDCFMAFATKKHFEKPGDTFFEDGSPVLVPVDGSDIYYYPEDASNYAEVLGENTTYTIDPEECMADNFGFLIAYDKKGPEGDGYKTPELIEDIRQYLQ